MTGLKLGQTQSDLPSPNPTSSYWHREPRLQGHRTTAELPAKTDVVIVGAGITGAFAARFLSGAGRDVVLLEAREVGWGATGRNGGHCQPNIYASKPHIAAFELRNYHFLRETVRAERVPCDWVSAPGVHAFYSRDLVSLAAERLERLAELHPSLAEAARLVTDRPALERLGVPAALGAVVQEYAASLWPYKLVAWVLEDLLLRRSSGAGGFNLQTGTPAVDIQRHGGSWIVHTPRGQIAAGSVLVAANGYTSRVIPRFTDVIVPVRGQVASLAPAWRVDSPLSHTYVFLGQWGSASMDDYLVQAAGGSRELVYGGGRTLGTGKGWGISSDEKVDPVVAAHLRRNLNDVLGTPGGGDGGGEDEDKEMPASYEWTGIMGYSADAHPWVGELPPSLVGGPGVFVCGGYTGHGMPVAALSARAVADMMCGGDGGGDDLLPPEFRVTEERIERVRAGERLSVEDYEELICPF
ncbi:uncharacterized protein DNG_09392 [Cephalotrichum gorgonifer]|uniref:FAD dependent oxidoreductase domain-containing protein n=1 Tax=Cephalotrichum gorgonifer TaxID=2041049 RepID=A0AAE8N7Q1_9PEZI|nr:uncharacterized protein DNG_09392 [Cephalotrichum gorgonifer]